MPHPLSVDLEAHIPALYEKGHSIKHICRVLSVKKSLIYQTLAYYYITLIPILC